MDRRLRATLRPAGRWLHGEAVRFERALETTVLLMYLEVMLNKVGKLARGPLVSNEASRHGTAFDDPVQHPPFRHAQLGGHVPWCSPPERTITVALPVLVPLAHCRPGFPQPTCTLSSGQLAEAKVPRRRSTALLAEPPSSLTATAPALQLLLALSTSIEQDL